MSRSIDALISKMFVFIWSNIKKIFIIKRLEILMLQPLGVECRYLHKAQLGLYVYNVWGRAFDVRACMDERVV